MYQIQVETDLDEFEDAPDQVFDSYDLAVEGCGTLFDTGKEDDFRIKDTETGDIWRIPAHKLVKEECPVCGKKVRVLDMTRTYDCNAIPYRMTCIDCWDKIRSTKGYDGEYYDSLDENLDEDY